MVSYLVCLIKGLKAVQSMQMCELAAEAHKSKGVVQSSGRIRIHSDSGQMSKSSVDALLSNNISAPFSQVIL